MSSRTPLSAQGLIKMLSFINCYLEVKDETVIYKKDTIFLIENTYNTFRFGRPKILLGTFYRQVTCSETVIAFPSLAIHRGSDLYWTDCAYGSGSKKTGIFLTGIFGLVYCYFTENYKLGESDENMSRSYFTP